MTRVVIFGYYGRDNWGDETNLAKLVTFIKQTLPESHITVISAEPTVTAQRFKVKAVAKFNFLGIISVLKEAKLLIGGGGSLFQDYTSLRSLSYYSALICLARILRVKVFLHGQGFGPIRPGIGRLIARWALAGVEVITVRDRFSTILLTELGIERPVIYLTAEPQLTLSKVPEKEVAAYWSPVKSKGLFRLGLVLRNYPLIKMDFWRRLIDYVSWDGNIEIYLINLAKTDLAFTQKLASCQGLTILPLERDWEKVQVAIGGLNLLVSSRLHGLVAALVQNTPAYGLAFEPRVENFCSEMGLPYYLTTPKTEWITLADQLVKYLNQVREGPPIGMELSEYWKARAIENWVVLKNYLRRIDFKK